MEKEKYLLAEELMMEEDPMMGLPYTKEQATLDARKVLLSSFAGELATLVREGRELAGYPFCSIVPFIWDKYAPVIWTANIAEHTKNSAKDGRASLLVRQVSRHFRIETGWRVSLIGDLCRVEDETEIANLAKRYYRHYPYAKVYERAHDFYWIRLNIKKIYVIMGFGKIRWTMPDDVFPLPAFSMEDEERFIEHIEKDHADVLLQCSARLKLKNKVYQDDLRLVAIHPYGMTLSIRNVLYELPFMAEAHDAKGIKDQVMLLADHNKD